MLLNDLTGGPSPQQNEKCDIAVVIPQLLNWHFESPDATTVRLNQLFEDVKGPVSNIEVKILDLIKHSFLKKQPFQLHQHFDARQHLDEGAYIGAGNDQF